MAGLTTNDVGGCCCEGDFCGPTCSACGGVHLETGGVIRDSNGEHALLWDAHAIDNLDGTFTPAWKTAVLTAPGQPRILYVECHPNPDVPDFVQCCPTLAGPGDIPYQYFVICQGDGTFLVQIITPAIVFATNYDFMPPSGSGFVWKCDGSDICKGLQGSGCATPRSIPWLPFNIVTVSPDCSDTTKVTGLATFTDDFVAGNHDWGTVHPPVPTATFSIPRETPNSHVCCGPCPIPKKDLTVSWVNTFSGTGSVPLVYTPPGQWNSACSNHLLYALSCLGNVQFGVTYFLTGDCPVGQRQNCVSPGHNPFNLVLADYTCNPFHLHYRCTVAGCVVLGDDGYADFYVDE